MMTVTKNKTLHTIVTLLILASTTQAQADCISDFFGNWATKVEKSVKVVGLRQDIRYAHYATGTLTSGTWVSQVSGGHLWTGTLSQLFSDRIEPCGLIACTQPFYAGAADQYTLTIFDNGAVTVNNLTWNFKFFPTVECLSNDMISFPLSGETWVVSAGAAQPVPPPPQVQ